MSLRELIVEEALTWIKTPYHDHSALKHIGCDCVGLLRGVAVAVGILDPAWKPTHYSPQWHCHQNEEKLIVAMAELGCMPRPVADAAPGDILAFQYGRVCSHTAILTARVPDSIVHASLRDGRVVHHRVDVRLRERVRYAFAFPGVCDL